MPSSRSKTRVQRKLPFPRRRSCRLSGSDVENSPGFLPARPKVKNLAAVDQPTSPAAQPPPASSPRLQTRIPLSPLKRFDGAQLNSQQKQNKLAFFEKEGFDENLTDNQLVLSSPQQLLFPATSSSWRRQETPAGHHASPKRGRKLPVAQLFPDNTGDDESQALGPGGVSEVMSPAGTSEGEENEKSDSAEDDVLWLDISKLSPIRDLEDMDVTDESLPLGPDTRGDENKKSDSAEEDADVLYLDTSQISPIPSLKDYLI